MKNFEDIQTKINNYRIQYNNNFRDKIIENMYEQIDNIVSETVSYTSKDDIISKIEIYADKFLTSRIGGIITLTLLLSMTLWITIIGANYVSSFLADIFSYLESLLVKFLNFLKVPEVVKSFLIDGIYKSVSMIVSVMLPPMAIFFPIFTFFEDLGLLPRIALNMDKIFKTVGADGKQALTMMVGFGCNAAGVISTRIIKSPKERLIAIMTNNFMPCNGRWPLLILLSSVFFTPILLTKFNILLSSLISALILVFSVFIGLFFTLILSYGMSKTLKSLGSFYIMEIPPFRKPNFLRILYNSLIDRTIFVLARAVYMAIPAGILVWILNHFNMSAKIINYLDPFGRTFGLDGVIILSYIIALPANELVIPSLIMLYTQAKTFVDIEEAKTIYNILINYGNWDWKTAISIMLFSILHNPCTTTLLTIYKETKNLLFTLLSFIIPLIIAFSTLFIINNILKFF